ncbi:TetR/AcrR family transcriptional regulator [Croceicoccus ponticola]|nr:TetR/AcrR family transcriptional regulator [Croceicoccus ponticola]
MTAAAPRRRGSGQKQAEKGAQLRAQVMDAAIDCLAEMPYSEISMEVIANRAGVSRGGMQYYFPTRLDVLQATVGHLHRERLDIFRNDLSSLRHGDDAIDHIIDSHWRHLNEREFRAYQELILAARSEPELADLLSRSYSAFIREWHEIARELIGWDADKPGMALGGNVAHYLLEGMAYGQIGGQISEQEIETLLDYAKSVMRREIKETGR